MSPERVEFLEKLGGLLSRHREQVRSEVVGILRRELERYLVVPPSAPKATLEEVRDALRDLAGLIGGGEKLPLLLTVKQAAFEFSVSQSTIKKLMREGVIKVVTIGRRVMVPVAEIFRLATPLARPERRPRTYRYSASLEAERLRAVLREQGTKNQTAAALRRKERRPPTKPEHV